MRNYERRFDKKQGKFVYEQPVGRKVNSFFIDGCKSSRKLKDRISSRVRHLKRSSFYIDKRNGVLIEDR